MVLVHSEQRLQQRRTTPGQPDNKERLLNFLLRDIGIKLPVSFHPQTRAQRL